MMEFNLKLEGRPEHPYKSLSNFDKKLKEQGDKHPVPMARHHIIPYNTLRDFYNKTVDNKKVKLVETALKGWVNKVSDNEDFNGSVSCENAKKLIGAVSSGKVNHSDSVKENRPEGYDDFRVSYAWMPGNLFIGPEGSKRRDDPGEGFEEKSKYIIGDIKFKLLKRIYENMNGYSRDVNFVDINKLNTISSDIKTLSGKYGRIHKLDGEQWEGVKGNYQIRNPSSNDSSQNNERQ